MLSISKESFNSSDLLQSHKKMEESELFSFMEMESTSALAWISVKPITCLTILTRKMQPEEVSNSPESSCPIRCLFIVCRPAECLLSLQSMAIVLVEEWISPHLEI